MHIVNLYPGSFFANTYLVESEGHAFVIDPGAHVTTILRRLSSDGCTLDGVLLTHGHFDHIESVDTLRQAVPGLKVCIHSGDAPMLTDSEKNGYDHFLIGDGTWKPADELLTDGQTLTVGTVALRVLHTPGHSPGSVCFLCDEEGVLFTGDTIFADGVGRWDLWGGDRETLRRSIASLSSLNGDLTIYPGHGDTSTLAHARTSAARFF